MENVWGTSCEDPWLTAWLVVTGEPEEDWREYVGEFLQEALEWGCTCPN